MWCRLRCCRCTRWSDFRRLRAGLRGAGAAICALARGLLLAQFIPMIESRFPVTAAQIDAVVAAFYARIRMHPVLGPVFASHVTDWPEHEAKIAAFWRNAIMFERQYDGNPMMVHKQAGNVRPGMFEPWLALFDEVLAQSLPEASAAAWSALAHRIGAGLRYGLVDSATDGPPRLV